MESIYEVLLDLKKYSVYLLLFFNVRSVDHQLHFIIFYAKDK